MNRSESSRAFAAPRRVGALRHHALDVVRVMDIPARGGERLRGGGRELAAHTPVGRHGAAFLPVPVQPFERGSEVEIIDLLLGHAAHEVEFFLLGTESAVVEVDFEPRNENRGVAVLAFFGFEPCVVEIVADALCGALQYDAGKGIVGNGADGALYHVLGFPFGCVLPQSDLGVMAELQVVGAQRLGVLHRADRDHGAAPFQLPVGLGTFEILEFHRAHLLRMVLRHARIHGPHVARLVLLMGYDAAVPVDAVE